jgi:Sulphur transport
MMVAITSLPFLLAAICAALMGYAIQRGATCTVAAISEIVRDGTAKRLLALAEASLWVAGGLITAHAFGLTPHLPDGFALSWWTVAGGMLLGIGAYANGACVFGSIARLGSGQWAYIMTPVGFYAGVASMGSVFGAAMPSPLAVPPSSGSGLIAVAFGLFAATRIVAVIRRGSLRQSVWQPHEATILIGITFTAMLLSVGSWAYTDLLIHLARRMADDALWQIALFVALLFGATFGGWTAGLLGHQRPSAVLLLRCFSGGMLMGWGSALIPGGNDGLILAGMPLLWPYAWIAILAMCATIWLALWLEQSFARA